MFTPSKVWLGNSAEGGQFQMCGFSHFGKAASGANYPRSKEPAPIHQQNHDRIHFWPNIARGMAVTTVLCEAQVDIVLENTKSIDTCSSSTLRLLRALLGFEDTVPDAIEARPTVKFPKQKQITTTAAAKSTKKSDSRNNAKYTVLDFPEAPLQCLPRNKRLTLATNTFNKTLKNLGDASKTKQIPSFKKSGTTRSPLKETQGRTAGPSKPTSKTATASRCLQSKLPELQWDRAQSTSPSLDCPSLLVTAECARTSLQCLRQLKTEHSATREQDKQVEQGALVLISKLQGLGLIASATEETLNVRKALEHVLQRQPENSKDDAKMDMLLSHDTLVGCIEFEYCGDNAKTFALITAFQAQVLQLIAVDDKSLIDEKLLQSLDPANLRSPCHMILHGAERGWVSAEKAAIQLHSLSQSILSICSFPSNGVSESPTTPFSPDTRFQLQCIALEIRCHWSRVAHHEHDTDKEIWAPFHRFVVSLRRNTGRTTKVQFLLVKNCLDRLLDTLHKTQNALTSGAPSVKPSSAVVGALQNMAEATGSIKNSSDLLHGLKNLCGGLAGLPAAIYYCKLANALLLDSASGTKTLILTLETVLNVLERPLRGTTTELEELLLQASRLRKVSAMRLTAITEDLRKTESYDESNSSLFRVCIRIIFGVLHFVAHYVGLKLQGDGDVNCTPKSSQRRQCSVLVAQQSLKSALAAVQSNITHEYVGWELCVAALADCLTVAKMNEIFRDLAIADVNNEDMKTTFVRISNLFWSWYLKQKELGACALDLLSVLDRSIQALEGRTAAEKKIGFLAVKCEKAAVLHTNLKQFHRAHQVLATGINAHIQDGTLSVAAQKAFSQSTQQIWGEPDSSAFVLGRVLCANARLVLKHQNDSSSSLFFDKTELKANERALLLEKQFVALERTLIPETLNGRLKEVAEVILSLYSESTHTSHQLRFISELLTFCSKRRLRPYQFLPEEALKICIDGSRRKAPLSVEGPHSTTRSLLSSLSLQWAFQTNTPSVDLLKEFVTSHTIAIESCNGWACVLGTINDPALVMMQVQSVIDFTDMRGLSQIKLDTLLLMRRLIELQPEKDMSTLASCNAYIGLQYTRMGLTSLAGRALANAENFLTQSESKSLIALQWHLAYAEYLTRLSSYEKAADQLISAQWRYQIDFVCDQNNDSRGSQLAQHKYLAQAAYLASDLAFENGDLDSAVLYAKKSVRISIRQWTVVEKLLGVKSSSLAVERSGSKIDGLVGDMSNMTLSTEDDPKAPLGKGAAFWASVQMHFDGLLHLSRLSAHQGNFQDAVYYAEQANKVGEATASDVLLCKASSILAAHLAQAGRADRGQLMVEACARSYGSIDHSADSFDVSMAMASARLARGEFTLGFEAVEQAQRAIREVQPTDCVPSSSESQKRGSVKAVPIKKASRSASRSASKTRKPRHPPTNSGVRTDVKETTADEVVCATGASTWVQRLQAENHLMKSRLCIRSGSCDDTMDLLEHVTSLARSFTSDAWCSLLQATLMLANALRLLQTDAVYSVLAESTVAYPTRQRKPTGDHRNEKTARDPTSTSVTTLACSSRKIANKQVSSHSGSLKPRELISKARELLLSFMSSSLSGSSSIVASEICGLLTRVQLLSSVLSTPSPLQITCYLNTAKLLHWPQEIASIGADIVLGDKSTLFAWPEVRDCGEAASACTNTALDYTVFQQQLNDGLPASWNVVTVAMSDNDSEILMSKIRHGQPPFLLRLPLDRTASGDADEKPLKFQTARSEMQDIIANANLTAHDAKARSDKQGKKQWWAAREALDARLASLLHDMETVWLGGFRGIFSDQCHSEELLSRFSVSLTRTLDRQLPSRRKACADIKAGYQLHSHVLELFVALGNPDEGDLDDAITDLLYFVIDILQFQGERNAYDEVDFDAMVLEVNDALRSHHEAAKDLSFERGGHTMLVLDKALHAFPWESLPCLEGRSVTRMPSLSCLQDRLQRIRQEDESSPGLYIDPHNGAYLLNPSSDLTSTQETFLDPFNNTLGDYTSIVNREPSETEFEKCLRDKDLCLYFGHGSGAQYIRGRTIKRLKQCAVTFLMGCSSSKMVECGQFEPYGVPYNYLYAGSAAVVGTLWDVTDKDIDRFAMEAFVNWGLLDRDVGKGGTKDTARKMKGKGRPRTEKMDLRGRPAQERSTKKVGLDEAVAKARDACLLRYLNGAAPVIYGIPVFLDR